MSLLSPIAIGTETGHQQIHHTYQAAVQLPYQTASFPLWFCNRGSLTEVVPELMQKVLAVVMPVELALVAVLLRLILVDQVVLLLLLLLQVVLLLLLLLVPAAEVVVPVVLLLLEAELLLLALEADLNLSLLPWC